MNSPTMPISVDAEKSVLGAILLDNEAYLESSESLTPEDFSLDSHRRIYTRMVHLMENNRPVDLITLVDELATHKDLQAVGDVGYISGLVDGVPDRPSIAHYIDIVRDKAMLRRIIHTCNATLARAYDQRENALPIMADMEDAMARIAGRPRNEARALKDLIPLVLDEMARERDRTTEYVGIPTGIKDLDQMLGGMRDSELWIAGGMPARGKTSFGIQLAIHAVQNDFPTIDFSLEMKASQVVRRIFAAHTPAEAFGARDAKLLSDAKWHEVIEGAAQLAMLPLFVEDSSSLSLRELRAKVKLYKKKFRIRLVVVDYLRLLTALGKDTRERVTNIALGLAQLAKDEDVCILALSQLSRPDDINHVPDMTDLKESGDLEASAHVVLLLYRPFDKDKGRFTGEDAIIVGKAREGPNSAVAVVYDDRTLTFKPRFRE
jgi:replicative DNA helicase